MQSNPEGTTKTVLKSDRFQWAQLPLKVRIAIQDIMGSPVAIAVSQPGGYSPGTADRIITKTGKRFFVKAVGSPINADSPDIHRKEIRIMNSLASQQLGSGLVGSYDDGEWVALVFVDIEGRHPDLSQGKDREVVMTELRRLTSSELSSASIDLLPSLSDDVVYSFDAWKRIEASPIADLDPWIVKNFSRLANLSGSASERLRGNYLSHTDLRKDNILITGSRAVIVDWPWAAAGVPWFDALTVIIDAGVYNPRFDPALEISQNPLLASCLPEDIDSVISGMMGYFFDCARKPSPAGIVSLRKFQQDEGLACLRILQDRWNN
jgi:hypothetical protein